MSSFVVNLYVLVVGSQNRRLMIHRAISLPFVPHAGLRISGINNPDGNLTEWPIESVCFDIATQCFECDMKNDTEQIDSQTPEEMIAEEWGSEWNVI